MQRQMEEQQKALEEKEFVVDIAYDYSNTYDSGVVMEQSKTGTAEKGSTVRIVVSMGKGTIEVPSVVGLNQSDAESTLANAGFSVGVETQHSDFNAGTVIAQSISGTVSADTSRNVTITVSSGPEEKTPEAPDEPSGDEEPENPDTPESEDDPQQP